MRRSVLILMVILAVIAASVVWYLARGSRGTADAPGAPGAAGSAGSMEAGSAAAGSSQGGRAGAPGPRSPSARGEARAKRDALREQIARQLASHQAANEAGSGSAAPPRSQADPRPRGNLRNNLGGRDALVAHLNEEFMPLASECIEQAEARSPRLSGMLAIGLETIADEQLGAVVDAADPAPTNNVADPLLFECIRESALSLTLPPPLTSGRERFELTLPVGPQPGSGAPR